MRALASGPFGVLVMVAPLVAIPILSTFGIPQFAPLVASPGEADADLDIVPTLPDDPVAELQPTTQRVPTVRTADDLFAPLDASLGSPAAPESASGRDPAVDVTEPGLVPLVPPSRPESVRIADVSGGRGLAESDRAMQGWDAIPARQIDSPVRQGLPDVASVQPEPGPVAPPDQGTGLRLPPGVDTEFAMPSASGTGQLTWKGAQRRLNELGIRKFLLESMSDGRFRFSCLFSNPDNPQIDRRFMAEADEPLLAVEKLLAQIDEWRAAQ